MTTAEFISLHATDDVRSLALQASRYKGIDMTYALTQIAALQTARRKLPSWAAIEGIEWPDRLPMEQCSSEATARIKQQIVARLIPAQQLSEMADLTGGLGVDFSFISRLFQRSTYIEKNVNLCHIAEKNFKLLGLSNFSIINGEAHDVLHQIGSCSLIYIDPARRLKSGSRAYALSDCQPDLGQLLPEIMAKSLWLMAKLSPMLDLKAVATSLAPYLCELHIIESEGECKELLALCSSKKNEGEPNVVCHTPQGEQSFPLIECGQRPRNVIESENIDSCKFIFLPHKSVAKAQPFGWLARQYGATMLAPDSHIYLSPHAIATFPGRQFELCSVILLSSPKLRQAMKQMASANIAVRNFPLTADQLRRKLRLSDGGPNYIFGTTSASGKHLLLICRKYLG